MHDQETHRWFILTPKGFRHPSTDAATPREAWDRLYRAWYPRAQKAEDYWIDDMQEEGYECVQRPVSTRSKGE